MQRAREHSSQQPTGCSTLPVKRRPTPLQSIHAHNQTPQQAALSLIQCRGAASILLPPCIGASPIAAASSMCQHTPLQPGGDRPLQPRSSVQAWLPHPGTSRSPPPAHTGIEESRRTPDLFPPTTDRPTDRPHSGMIKSYPDTPTSRISSTPSTLSLDTPSLYHITHSSITRLFDTPSTDYTPSTPPNRILQPFNQTKSQASLREAWTATRRRPNLHATTTSTVSAFPAQEQRECLPSRTRLTVTGAPSAEPSRYVLPTDGSSELTISDSLFTGECNGAAGIAVFKMCEAES